MGFYIHRLNLYLDTTPYNGFKMLLDLVKEKNDDYFVVTANVDGKKISYYRDSSSYFNYKKLYKE